ncbi:alpha/beta hydrolase [Candidatus Daviesbacteria bacterium]|nr:alpha/beta hydrolase [Candidatus Daviesbacteria bacterium]
MYITINNQRIYFQKVGTGKNLILLHGWGLDSSTFWPSVDLLKDNLTLWILDLPGFGRSDIPKKAFNTKDYAQIIADFIRKKKISKPTLLGHSFGGKISIRFANLYPNLMDKLILVGSAGLKRDHSFANTIAYPLAKIVHYLIPDIFNIKTIIRKKFYKKIESDYENAGVMKDTLLKTLKEDLTDNLKKVGNETLLIWGDADRAVPLKYGKRMYRLLPNSKLIIMEEQGHFLHVHDPERFANYVKLFLE